MKHHAQNLAQLLAGASALAGTLAGLTVALYDGQHRAVAGSSATVAVFATLKVQASIATQKRSDFHFRSEEPGAPMEKIPATDSLHAASVMVSGVGHQAYALSFPQHALLRNVARRSFSPIAISDLHSDQPANLGYLGGEGHESVSLGATRAKLADNQPRGAYCGSVPITVVYP